MQMLKKIMSKKVLLVFLAIIFLGIFLRVHRLGVQSFVADEFIGINIAVGYNETGEWKFWEFNKGALSDEEYTRANVYYWQVAKTFDFLPPSEATARLASVGWGIIAMVTVFLATFVITRNWAIALIALFLSAISITELMYDRKLRMYSMFAPVYLWLSYAVYKFLEYKKVSIEIPFLQKFFGSKKEGAKSNIIEKVSQKTGLNWVWFLPALLLGYLSLKVHLLTVNILPTILVYLLVMGIFFWVSRKQFKNRYLIILGIFSLVGLILAIGVSTFKTIPIVGFILSKAMMGIAGINLVFHWTYLEKITLDYSYILFGIFFVLLGGYWMIKKYGKIGLWTVLSFLVPLLLAIFSWERNVGDQYIYLVQLFKVMIVAVGVYFFSKKISNAFEQSKKAFIPVLFMVLLLLVNFGFFFSGASFYGEPKSWEYTNYREGFTYFLKHKSEDAAIFVRPLTNYYLRGTNTNVLAYNDTNKVTLERVVMAQKEYEEVWAIFSQNTNINGDARRHIEREFELKEDLYTNQKLKIYVWRKN